MSTPPVQFLLLQRRRVHEEEALQAFWVTRAARCVCRLRKLPYLLHLLGRKRHLQRVQVLFQVLDDPTISITPCSLDERATYRKLCSSRDRDNIVTLRKQPRESDLPGRRAVLLADSLQAIRDLQDVREVLLRVARHRAPEIILVEVIRPFLCVQSASVLQGLGSSTFEGNSRICR